MDNIKKVDSNTISADKTIPQKVVTSKYDYGFLKQQLIDIQKQKDDFDALRDAELAEVNTLIAEADKLGIVEKVEEVISPVEIVEQLEVVA